MTYRRRPPGAALGASKIYARVHPDAAQTLDDVARRLGVSKAEFLESLLLHLGATLNQRGTPDWWSKPIPDSEELDLRAS